MKNQLQYIYTTKKGINNNTQQVIFIPFIILKKSFSELAFRYLQYNITNCFDETLGLKNFFKKYGRFKNYLLGFFIHILLKVSILQKLDCNPIGNAFLIYTTYLKQIFYVKCIS